jgi:hypothetical protein
MLSSTTICRSHPQSAAVSRSQSQTVTVSRGQLRKAARIRAHSRSFAFICDPATSDSLPSTALRRPRITPVPCRIRPIDRSGRLAFVLFSHTTVHCRAYDKRVESLVGQRSAKTVHPRVCCTSSLCTEFGRTAWRAPARTRFVITFHIGNLLNQSARTMLASFPLNTTSVLPHSSTPLPLLSSDLHRYTGGHSLAFAAMDNGLSSDWLTCLVSHLCVHASSTVANMHPAPHRSSAPPSTSAHPAFCRPLAIADLRLCLGTSTVVYDSEESTPTWR